jgi:hypothetical protein
MYQVNYSNPNATRIPKNSAYVFSEITKNRKLPAEYLRKTGEMSEDVVDADSSQNRNTSAHRSTANCNSCSALHCVLWVAAAILSSYPNDL